MSIKNVRLFVNWAWREEHEYNVTKDLPENWDSLSGTEKMDWLEQFDSTMMDSYPLEFLEVVDVEVVEY